MNHRHLGRSGLVVSEIAFGNWITHGSQLEKEAAVACVRAALEEGVTTFDTADTGVKGRESRVEGQKSRHPHPGPLPVGEGGNSRVEC